MSIDTVRVLSASSLEELVTEVSKLPPFRSYELVTSAEKGETLKWDSSCKAYVRRWVNNGKVVYDTAIKEL